MHHLIRYILVNNSCWNSPHNPNSWHRHCWRTITDIYTIPHKNIFKLILLAYDNGAFPYIFCKYLHRFSLNIPSKIKTHTPNTIANPKHWNTLTQMALICTTNLSISIWYQEWLRQYTMQYISTHNYINTISTNPQYTYM